MADTKTTDLTLFTPIRTDLLYGVDDPAGTPVSGKITFASIFSLFSIDEDNMASNLDTAWPTQQSVKAYVKSKDVQVIEVEVFAPTRPTAVGDGQVYIHIPSTCNGKNLTTVRGMVVGAGTTGQLTVQVRNVTDGADMLSTAMTIDSAQLTNATASVPLVINASTDDVVTGDVLRIDIDTVHSTPAEGLVVTLEFAEP